MAAAQLLIALHGDASALCGHVGAERPQRQLGVIARLDRFDHRGRAVGLNACKQNRALDLRARHGRLVRDAMDARAAVNDQRRIAVV